MDFIIDYYFDFGLMSDEFGRVWDGFWITLKLSVVAGALSLIWGLILAVMRQLPGRALAPIRWAVIGYIDAFRGVPLLLILLLANGFLGAAQNEGVIPRELALPTWFGESSLFWHGVLALTLTYGAYMAEVYRAGIEAVPHGQTEAARSLGMSHAQAMRYVIVPQAVRKVIPPLLNDFIALMKDTSLVSVIALLEVVQVGRDIQVEFGNGSALVLGAIFFLVITIPLARIVDALIAREQRKTGRGGAREDDDGLPSATAFAGGTPPTTGGGVGAG